MNIHVKQAFGGLQIKSGMQLTLAKKLKRFGVDVKSCFVEGDQAACARAIRALADAERALERPVPTGSEPTRERRAKGRAVEAVPGTPGQPNAHRMVWPVDELRKNKLITPAEYEAAERYRAQHETLHRSQGVTNWESTGSPSFGPRIGLTERQQIAGAELARANVALGNGSIRAAAINFILEVPAPGLTSVLGWPEFAKTQVAVSDNVGARWVAYTWCQAACQKLAAVYEALDAEARLERRKRA